MSIGVLPHAPRLDTLYLKIDLFRFMYASGLKKLVHAYFVLDQISWISLLIGLVPKGDGEDSNTLMTEDSLKYSEPSLDSLSMWRDGAARPGADSAARQPLHKAGVAVSWELGSATGTFQGTICSGTIPR